FRTLRREEIVEALLAEGIDVGRASEIADAATGRLDRARLLASDPEFEARRRAWRALPGELDSTGATVARVVDELGAMLDSAAEALVRNPSEALLLQALLLDLPPRPTEVAPA